MSNPAKELFPWSAKYQIGIEFVDTQHKQLVEIINRLHEAMMTGKGRAVLGHTLDELIAYTKAHFAAEEKVLDNCGYPDFPAHHGEHVRLTNSVVAFQQKLMRGELAMSVDVMAFLKDWLGQHILNVDKKYVSHLKGKGVM